jgi:large subunit ribosomal protein L29
VRINEVRALGAEEMKKHLESAHEELFNVRLRLATKQLTNHREIPRLKKTISRINTILRERELGVRQD